MRFAYWLVAAILIIDPILLGVAGTYIPQKECAKIASIRDFICTPAPRDDLPGFETCLDP